jgi:hypothetical protein
MIAWPANGHGSSNAHAEEQNKTQAKQRESHKMIDERTNELGSVCAAS